MKNIFLSLLIASLAALVIAVSPLQTSEALAPLTISYINAGQGDSILIRDTDGFDVLIDGGRTSAGPAVVDYLRSQGVDDLEVMLATHPDADHIGGLIDVLALTDLPVLQVLYSGYPGSSDTWTDFTTAVANEGLSLTTAQYPQALTWGTTSVSILSPVAGLVDPETNAASVVVMVTYGQNRFLFTGDITTQQETEILARGSAVDAAVLKVAHHGSAYASSAGFLSAVGMDEAVISVGANSYGHPAQETLDRLTAAGAVIFRTDLNGTIVVTSDGVSYTVTPEHGVLALSIFLPGVLREDAPPPPGPLPSGNIQITHIFYDGSGSQEPDEYVEIRNEDTSAIQLSGWTLRDLTDHVFTFPEYVMAPGQVCRVYTNEAHPEWCGFNYQSATSIWNNTGDTAFLRDLSGTLWDTYGY